MVAEVRRLSDTMCLDFLAQLKLLGLGVRADSNAADSLYRVAAGLGSSKAMAIIAWNHLYGIRTKKDTFLAIIWNAKSAEYGHLIAARNVSGLYWTPDPLAAAAYLDIGVQLGDSTSIDWMNKLKPALVKGGNEEYERARPLFYTNKEQYAMLMQEAMREGNMLAAGAMVEAYQNGTGVKMDVFVA